MSMDVLKQRFLQLKQGASAAYEKLPLSLRRDMPSYVMLFPYFLLFFFFTVLPVLASMVLSFTDFNMLEWPQFTGWTNYIRLLVNDDLFIVALKNTLLFAVITGPVSYLMCLLVAPEEGNTFVQNGDHG